MAKYSVSSILQTVLLGGLSLVAITPAHAAPRAGLAPASYTQEQAARGAETYKEACSLCHGASLGGAFDTPALKGRFVANWAGAPLRDLFDYMQRAMPLSAPSTLSAEDNADILAFLLQENGVKPGKKPLPAEGTALARVQFPKAKL
ncbi:MAG: c-type cytochrome [Acetobacter sp.]|uniref:c-type cytochrome n=1 Tax=Acetobacter sp. TaxID=440 RepID=UPI003F8ED047